MLCNVFTWESVFKLIKTQTYGIRSAALGCQKPSVSQTSEIVVWVKLHGKEACRLTNSIVECVPWKLRICLVGEEIPLFYGTRKFSAVFTKIRHWILSWENWIQSSSHPVFRLTLILSRDLHQGLLSRLSFPPNQGGTDESDIWQMWEIQESSTNIWLETRIKVSPHARPTHIWQAVMLSLCLITSQGKRALSMEVKCTAHYRTWHTMYISASR